MASQLSSVNVQLVANTAVYVRELLTAQKATEQKLKAMKDNYDGFTDGVKKTGPAVDQANKSMGKMRGIAGQLGYQLQDTAVQLQMGTNALVVLGQQGSQFAGAFGPTGAVVGAVIAVGSALLTGLVPSLFDSKDGLSKLEEMIRKTTDTLDLALDGTNSYSEEIKRIAAASKELLKVKLAVSISEQQSVFKQQGIALRQLTDDLTSTTWGFKSFEDVVTELSGKKSGDTGFHAASEAIKRLKREVVEFNLEPGRDQIDALERSTTYLSEAGLANTESGKKLLDSLIKLNADYKDGKLRLEEYRKALEDTALVTESVSDKTDKSVDHLNDYISGLALQVATLGMTNYEMDLYKAGLNGATEEDIKAISALQEKIKAYDKEQKAIKDKEKALKASAAAQAEIAKLDIKDAQDRQSIFNPESFEATKSLMLEQFTTEKELLETQKADLLLTEEQYQLKKRELYKTHGDQLLAQEMGLYNGLKSIASSMGNNYLSVSEDLAGATEEEKKTIKRNFLLKQAGAAAEASVDYWASLMAIEATAAAMGPAGIAYSGIATSKATTTFALTMAGIAGATLGGVAAFNTGSEYIPNDQLAFIHKAERIIQPNINDDLTSFLASQKDGNQGQSPVVVNQNVSFGGIYDKGQMQTMLAKESKTIAGLVTREQKRRPNQRRV